MESGCGQTGDDNDDDNDVSQAQRELHGDSKPRINARAFFLGLCVVYSRAYHEGRLRPRGWCRDSQVSCTSKVLTHELEPGLQQQTTSR